MMNATVKDQKKALRRLMRELKSQISQEQKQSEADTVFAAIEATPEFSKAESILLYYSLPDELPTHEVLQCWHAIKRIYLPRVKGDDLEIVAYNGMLDDDNDFHIGEPVGPALDVVPDMVIVPAVALDANRNRLGRGKGFYDRLLNNTTCPTIGVVCDFQLVEEVPVEPHDQPLDCVVTSDEVYCDETKRQLFQRP